MYIYMYDALIILCLQLYMYNMYIVVLLLIINPSCLSTELKQYKSKMVVKKQYKINVGNHASFYLQPPPMYVHTMYTTVRTGQLFVHLNLILDDSL